MKEHLNSNQIGDSHKTDFSNCEMRNRPSFLRDHTVYCWCVSLSCCVCPSLVVYSYGAFDSASHGASVCTPHSREAGRPSARALPPLGDRLPPLPAAATSQGPSPRGAQAPQLCWPARAEGSGSLWLCALQEEASLLPPYFFLSPLVSSLSSTSFLPTAEVIVVTFTWERPGAEGGTAGVTGAENSGWGGGTHTLSAAGLGGPWGL